MVRGGEDYFEDAFNVNSTPNAFREAIPLDVSALPTLALIEMQNM